MIDRQRAQIDILTALVPVVLLSAMTAVAMLMVPEEGLSNAGLLGVYRDSLILALGPQLAQALVGQLVLTRLRSAPVRGLLMVGVWYLTAATIILIAAGGPTLWAVYVGGFIVLPLQVVTRLLVRAVVKVRYRRRAQSATAA